MRILEVPIVKLSHTVVSIGIHEEGQDTLFYTGKTMEAKRRRIEEGLEHTKFTGWLVQLHNKHCKGWNSTRSTPPPTTTLSMNFLCTTDGRTQRRSG